MTATLVVKIPIVSPLLSLNQRLHWAQRSAATRAIRDEVIWQVRHLGVGALEKPTVTLHLVPKDKRRRDVDNLVPTSKAAVDGLVAAGVLADDSPAFVDHRMPVIEVPDGDPRVWIEVAS